MPESKHRRNRRGANRGDRATDLPRATRRSGTNKWLLAVFAVMAVLLIISFIVPTVIDSLSGPNQVTLGSAQAYVEGVGEKQEIMRSKNHVDQDDNPANDDVVYNSAPPASGDHWSAANRCGFFNDPVPDERIVHNLEHSNIVISYNLPDPADLARLEDYYNDMDAGWRNHFTVARPYAEIGAGQVALSAWGVIDVMDGVDPERIDRFYEHYVGRLGPEGAISCRGAPTAMPGG